MDRPTGYQPIDYIRKLALTGLLQFVHYGSGAQVLFGCVIAVSSLALQLRLEPCERAHH